MRFSQNQFIEIDYTFAWLGSIDMSVCGIKISIFYIGCTRVIYSSNQMKA